MRIAISLLLILTCAASIYAWSKHDQRTEAKTTYQMLNESFEMDALNDDQSLASQFRSLIRNPYGTEFLQKLALDWSSIIYEPEWHRIVFIHRRRDGDDTCIGYVSKGIQGHMGLPHILQVKEIYRKDRDFVVEFEGDGLLRMGGRRLIPGIRYEFSFPSKEEFYFPYEEMIEKGREKKTR